MLEQPTGPMTVPFDDTASCGLRVERRQGGSTPFVSVQVVTRRGEEDAHDLTIAQATRLRDTLNALIN